MKKLSIFTLTMIALGFMATTVRAQSPHYITCSASGPAANGSLQVCFKLAGLGANQGLSVTAPATASVEYRCQNNGGQCPNAANKEDIRTAVSATGTFTSDQNGQITGCLTILAPPSILTCPPGQNRVFFNVTYTSVYVSAPGTPSNCNISGSFARSFFPTCP
jgi:hypothetical protein